MTLCGTISALPDDGTLAGGLAAVFPGARLAVLRRRRHAVRTTFPTEFVTCRLADGGSLSSSASTPGPRTSPRPAATTAAAT